MFFPLMLALASTVVYAQSIDTTHIEMYNSINKIDSLIANNKLSSARQIYEDLSVRGFYIQSWKQYSYIDILYFDQGLIEKAKSELIETIKKGYLNQQILYGSDSIFLESIGNRYGYPLVEKLLIINDNLRKTKLNQYGKIINELIKLNDLDQELYRNKQYRKSRNYWFSKTYGYPVKDTTINHVEAMSLYKEFRKLDSIKTERFVKIIDSLGYVPDERITGGLTANVLVIHSCKYKKLSSDIDAIYQHSLKIGSMSPHEYAWYKGYYDERHSNLNTYYYTTSRDELEKFSATDKKLINSRRKLIGLRPCPAVVWNNDIYSNN